MAKPVKRIGLIVPSSNTTMETEIPQLLRDLAGDRAAFTFHGARVRMKHVQQDELVAMNARAEQAMTELMDAPLDAVAFACLVAIMAMGHGYHAKAAEQLRNVARDAGRSPAVVTSAGALVDQLKARGARKVALVMPYADPLARAVADYLEAEGLMVSDYVNLSVTDNAEVGRIPGATVLGALDRLQIGQADAVVLSACVQMPSLDLLVEAERRTGLPTTSAALCTAQSILQGLDIAADSRGVLQPA